MKASVVSVGDANVDLIAPVPFFPEKGGEVLIDRLETRAGGSAANLSVAVSRLGLMSGFIGRVGNDSFGRFLTNEFKKEKVNISQLQVDEEIGTGLTFILVTQDGERTMFCFRGANVHLSPDEIDINNIRGKDVLHISGYSLLRGPQRKAALKALELAKKEGVLVSFDAGVYPAMKATDLVLSTIKSVDLLFLNELEAASLTGIKNPEKSAKRALKLGPNVVAMKLGKGGCLILTEEEKIFSPAFNIKVVDTTGAGDAFDAGFLAGIIEGLDIKMAARFANAVGALSTMKVGARSALPNRWKVERFLRRFGNAESYPKMDTKQPGAK